MSIEYMLVESKINGSPVGCRAVVQSSGQAGLADVVQHMLRDDCPLDQATIETALKYFFSAIRDMVLEGRYVTTPSANYRASIRGRFEHMDDGFDTDRHQVVAAAAPGLELRRAVRTQARVERQETVKPQPLPLLYSDVQSGELNGALTPGAPGLLRGHRLSHDPADPEQGIFFRAADGSVTRVETIIRNKPREVAFMVPALAPGEYTLEVRARIKDGSELRTGVLAAPLTVA